MYRASVGLCAFVLNQIISRMIADINITEKSFGPKSLMKNVRFSIDDGEKVGIVGRNGIGKSTLFAILTARDKDFSGEVIFRRGLNVVSTAQDHHGIGDKTVLQYILAGIPEYSDLAEIIETYPEKMGDDLAMIERYTQALERFDQKGFYQIEEKVERELENFQLVAKRPSELASENPAEGDAPLETLAHRKFATLSGGQKRLTEVVKIMHADAQLALVDEPTNHMDYVAKRQFIDWMKSAREAVLVITHDRDVLAEVDRIIELKDGGSISYHGNYDAYLRQNAERTSTGMNDFEMIEKRITNLKQKVIDYQRLKEKSRNPSTIQKFKRLENQSRAELAELQAIEKPTFWIDKNSVENLDYRAAGRYEKFKTKNIRMNIRGEESRSKHVLVTARNLSLGYETPLFDGINIDLREGEAVELRGRNGAGKSTLIKGLLSDAPLSSSQPQTAARRSLDASPAAGSAPAFEKSITILSKSGSAPSDVTRSETNLGIVNFSGELKLDPQVRVGVYEQEIPETYFELNLHDAIEKIYLDRNLSISETKIRNLMSDYLFIESDMQVPVSKLSGGQKARLQIIKMLSNDPQLLILDEPTNHLDLPSIEELETALEKYSGAILYVSHDDYFRRKLSGEVIQIGR